MLGAFISTAAPLLAWERHPLKARFHMHSGLCLLMQCGLFVAFTSHVRTMEHCCSQFFHCISCNIYYQMLREKKAFHLLQEEENQSLPSHHTYITPAFFTSWTWMYIHSDTGFGAVQSLRWAKPASAWRVVDPHRQIQLQLSRQKMESGITYKKEFSSRALVAYWSMESNRAQNHARTCSCRHSPAKRNSSSSPAGCKPAHFLMALSLSLSRPAFLLTQKQRQHLQSEQYLLSSPGLAGAGVTAQSSPLSSRRKGKVKTRAECH